MISYAAGFPLLEKKNRKEVKVYQFSYTASVPHYDQREIKSRQHELQHAL